MIFSPFKKDKLTALAVSMKKGDREAAGVLYDELATKTYSFLFLETEDKNAAEQLLLEIFDRLAVSVNNFNARNSTFEAWFWNLTQRTLSEYRQEKNNNVFVSLGSRRLAVNKN